MTKTRVGPAMAAVFLMGGLAACGTAPVMAGGGAPAGPSPKASAPAATPPPFTAGSPRGELVSTSVTADDSERPLIAGADGERIALTFTDDGRLRAATAG